MRLSLILQGLYKPVDENFLEGIKEVDRVDLEERAKSAIFMSVTNNVLCDIADENRSSRTWKKLEKLYSAKSLTKRLYVKKQLYNMRIMKVHLLNSILMNLIRVLWT